MNRSALWVGAGCLGCIGVPSLLAIGGAGGYFFALSQEPVAVEISGPSDRIASAETESSSWAASEARTREAREREEALVKELPPDPPQHAHRAASCRLLAPERQAHTVLPHRRHSPRPSEPPPSRSQTALCPIRRRNAAVRTPPLNWLR